VTIPRILEAPCFLRILTELNGTAALNMLVIQECIIVDSSIGNMMLVKSIYDIYLQSLPVLRIKKVG
jgi:hypothetical protein